MTGLLIAAAAAALILWMPVGISAACGQGKAQVALRIGPIAIRVYPVKPRKVPKKPKKTEVRLEKREKKPAIREKTAFTKEEILAMAHGAAELAGYVKRRLTITDLRVCVRFGGEDAAKAAVNYGRAWALIGAVTPILENSFRILRRDLRAEYDFQEKTMEFQAAISLRIRVGQLLAASLRVGSRLLTILKNKKRRCKYESSTS